MPIVEPPQQLYEPEYRHQFEAESPSGPHVIVQGSVETYLAALLGGNEDDDVENIYDVRLLVGPYWRDVRSVVPKVSIDGLLNFNSDEDDALKWDIFDLHWDTVGEFGPNNDELRIRLSFKVGVRGEHSYIARLGYYLIARGRQLGAGGINQPGPVKQQG